MRTLKKVLAMTLAMATMLSISILGLGFKDEQSINTDLVTDIELLNALEIMVGDNKGNFNPERNITRAEAAKMMYVLKLKRDDGSEGWIGSSSTYSDTKGHWAEGYIAYCTNVGILAGNGKGQYMPDKAISGVELAKLLLVASGYTPDKAGFGGAQWQTSILKVASEVNLFDSYEQSYTGPAQRQWAAKLFANMLNTVPMVKYSKDFEGFVPAHSDERTYGQHVFGLNAFEGIATANKNMILGTGTTEAKHSVVGGVNIDFNVASNLLGQSVRVIYKDSNKNGAVDISEPVYGVYAGTGSTAYSIAADKVTVKDSTIKFEGYNGGNAKDYSGKTITMYTLGGMTQESVAPAAFASKLFNKSNTQLKLIDADNNGFIDSAFNFAEVYAIVNTFDSAKTVMTLKDANGSAVTIKDAQNNSIIFNNTSAGRENWKQLSFSDTVEKGDVVAIRGSIETGKLVYTIKKLTPVTGKLSSVASDGAVKIGDTSYKLSANTVLGATLPTSANLGKTFNLYTDGKYVVFAGIDDGTGGTSSELSGNLAYVVDARADVNSGVDEWGNPKKANKVDILKADGTRGIYEYEVPKGIDNASAFAASMKDTVVEFVIASGKVYFKNQMQTPTGVEFKAENNSFDKDKKTFGGYMTTSDSYFFVKSVKTATCTQAGASAEHKADCDNQGHTGYTATEYDYAVLKATELKTNVTNTVGTGFNSLAVKKINGLPTLLFGTIVTEGGLPNAASSTDYVYVTDSYYTELEDDTVIVRVPAQNSKGESVLLKMQSGSAPAAHRVYKVTTDTKGISTLQTADFTAGTVTGFGGNLVKLDGVSDFMNITPDTKIWYVDLSGEKPALTTGEGITLAIFDDKDGDGVQDADENLMQNVLYKLNKDGDTITDIFVEVNGATITSIK